MSTPWYKIARECVSIRKNVLRADMCIFIDDETAFANVNFLNSTIKSILTSAIIKGLDIVGILTDKNPNVGIKAQKMALEQQMDIVVIPGQRYVCSGKEEIYVYKLAKPLPLNLPIDKACEFAHKNGGFVIASNISKKQVQVLNKLQGSTYAPDAVEIFNSKVGGYRNLDIDYFKFVSSGATSANDLENTNVFTLLERKEAVEMRLVEENTGVDYVPKYLKPKKGVV
jgi:hypothetical protein